METGQPQDPKVITQNVGETGVTYQLRREVEEARPSGLICQGFPLGALAQIEVVLGETPNKTDTHPFLMCSMDFKSDKKNKDFHKYCCLSSSPSACFSVFLLRFLLCSWHGRGRSVLSYAKDETSGSPRFNYQHFPQHRSQVLFL